MYRIIFKHKPKAGQEADYIKQWQWGSDIIQTYPGARGTKLFRDKQDPGILYAMAEWESKEARDKARQEIDKRPDAEEVSHKHTTFLDSHETIADGDLIAESNPPQK